MLMQKHSPNNKIVENDEININYVESMHTNGHFFSGRNPSLAGSECNDDKSNDGCSSDDESHEHENTEQENQTSFIDSSNREHFKSSLKKKKKKAVKVKFAGSQDDKAGIKLKIRRTNNFNQDENHVIVDNAEQQQKRHLKSNKRCKSLSQDGSVKMKSEESDENLSQKRSKTESDDESRVSIGVNTISKGTDVDESCLGQCQAGTRLSLESVVLMETKSGIVIVSVQWRGKTLMGALMESERFQIGSLEKDCIYRREKLMGMTRRNTRRKSKNLFGKKKRKLTTPNDSGEHPGTENEAGNSDVDNPYVCDKESCHMRFADFQTLRVHIYQKHRAKGELKKFEVDVEDLSKKGDERSKLRLNEEDRCGQRRKEDERIEFKKKDSERGDLFKKECVKSDLVRSGCARADSLMRLSLTTSQTKPSITDLVKTEPSDERNTFSPAYSDISDANEAPVLENEAEQKPSPASVVQPPINLSLCHNPALLAASNRMLFSPTAPALQPEVTICSSSPHQNLRNDCKLPQLPNYRFQLAADSSLNGFIHGLSANHKPQNGALSLSSVSNIPVTDSSINFIQDLSSNVSKSTNNHHKTAPNLLNCQKQPLNRHPQHIHTHHPMHSNNTSLSNGLTTNNHHSKHSLSSENGIPNQSLSNGLQLSQSLSHMSFSPSVNNNQNNKYNHPTNHMSLYHQPKY